MSVSGAPAPWTGAAPEHPQRPLRLDAPRPLGVTTSDGYRVGLTRYSGGSKGPVMLAPGFGTTTYGFVLDTVETNLTEFLVAEGYDVWLFDYRASPALDSADQPYSVDDIALRDWPAAVDTVRAETGADSVQVVAHCVGSISFLMAKLGGLEGVRSAVSSALTTHPAPPTSLALKTGLHFSSFLEGAGVDTITTDYEGDWDDRVIDRLMHAYPTQERCELPECRRILFIYGEVFDHDQLNTATHQAVPEMFGMASLSPFRHLARIMRKGHVVNTEGEETYLTHLDRLAFPLTFIHGANNRMFLPEGTKNTYDIVREANGDHWYKHHVIPGYSHMDAFIGKDASRDVFPLILQELAEHQ